MLSTGACSRKHRPRHPTTVRCPRMKHVRANGIDIAYLEQGTGPLVLLLHGFPDNARSWERQLPALAAAGYRAVAPNLRGYPPSEIPAEGFYDRAIAMAIPHPAVVANSMLDARHVHHSFHWWLFQLPGLPEQALAANDFAFIDYLWRYWSAPGHEDAAHVADIKRMLAEPGALTATLGYYRAMLDPDKADPRRADARPGTAFHRRVSLRTRARGRTLPTSRAAGAS